MTIIDDEQKLGKLLKKATPIQKSRLYTYGFKFLSTKKQTRDNSTIKQEYDLSAYQYLLTKKIWNEKNLEDLCYIRIINGTLENNNSISTSLFNEKLYSSKLINLKKLYAIKLIKIITKLITPNDTLCELGCGFGKYLFLLRQNGISSNLEGYDISLNGIELARKINSKFETNINFKQFDMTKDLRKIDFSNKIIFTHLALEQLKPELENIIGNLIKCKPKEVIHFEHFPQLYTSGLRHSASKIYYDKKDYQTKLFEILSKYDREEKINLISVERFPHALNPLHEMGVIRWKIN